MRADPEYDAGITGAIKRARVAEGFGLDVEYDWDYIEANALGGRTYE